MTSSNGKPNTNVMMFKKIKIVIDIAVAISPKHNFEINPRANLSISEGKKETKLNRTKNKISTYLI